MSVCACMRACVCVRMCVRTCVCVCENEIELEQRKKKTETRMTGSILKQDAFKRMKASFELVMCLKYN